MDSINKTSKIVVIIAVILFVVIVVGFVVGMFAMYNDMISGFEPDSGENLNFSEVYMDVPNINNIGDRIPDINYAYAAEGEVTYALSDEVMELDPAAKAVPFSRYSNYYEFSRGADNIDINYLVYPSYEYKGQYINLFVFLFQQKFSEYCFNLDLDPIRYSYSFDGEPYKNNLPSFDNGYNFIFDYTDIIKIFDGLYMSAGVQMIKDNNLYKYGNLSLISRGSGCILKIVDDETGEFVLQGGYDLSEVLLNNVVYGVSDGIYEVPVYENGYGTDIIGYQPHDGVNSPGKFNVLSLFFGDPVTGLEIKDRELWDPNDQFAVFDSAYFYSYDDSYFELVSTIGVPYWDPIAQDIGGYNEVSTYTRFRVY